MNNFDVIYYINLDRRKDRKEHILKELEKMDIDMEKVKRIPGVEEKVNALGCSKAHLNALLDCQNNDYKNCLVLEDDFMFIQDKNKVNELLNKFKGSNTEWDVLMVSGHIKKFTHTNFPYLLNVEYALTTSGYAVNKSFLPTLIENYKEGIEILANRKNRRERAGLLDVHWGILQPISKWFVLYPKLGRQRPDYSDISKQKVDFKVQELNDLKSLRKK